MADLFASPIVELHACVDDKPLQVFRGRFAWTLDALLQAGDADDSDFPAGAEMVAFRLATSRGRRVHRNDR